MKLTKMSWIVIVGAAVIIIGLIFAFYPVKIHLRSPLVFLPDPQNVVKENNERGFRAADENVSLDRLKEISGGTATNAVSYENALDLYRGKVVQFNENCRAYPIIMTLPAKSVVMLDNRSNWDRTIVIGARTYAIAPYDYVLATFNDRGDYKVSCDSLKDVGIVSIL
jgi:hypothetical protein